MIHSVEKAKEIVRRVFHAYSGSLAVRFWNGETVELGAGSPRATVIFRAPGPFRELALFRDPLRFAEAYFHGLVDVEGNLFSVLEQKEHLQSLSFSAPESFSLLAAALLLGNGLDERGNPPVEVRRSKEWPVRPSRKHSQAADRKAIAFHYDVSNDFYGLWLDGQMVYSCAYFENADDSLDEAQRNKLDYLCRKLRLRQSERLLDIGCGWGALICWAAKHYGVQAHGITLSRNQYEYARTKIREQGLEKQVTVELRDYRNVAGEAVYDKIVSVGMFEHVGLKNLPLYFRTAHRLLKPDGLFLNHGITHDEEGWRKSHATTFINRYVFPDGELDTASNVQRVMERSQFEILDVEALRPHYALTLRHWVSRLEQRREKALQYVDEATYRIWRLYMTACALEFESGGAGVYQILASRRQPGAAAVALTRRDLYDRPCGQPRSDAFRPPTKSGGTPYSYPESTVLQIHNLSGIRHGT
ncbi:MAG: class I SAM-dependent methyltransferase [Betaproteobacteria bacterium]|nr:class I SAM-dependent methyltransferase [Betaproteobacteria bacterium]